MSLTKDEAAELKRLADAPKLIIKEVDGQIEGVDFNVNPELIAYIDSLTQPAPEATFQNRVAPWMQECFGTEISSDKVERNHRFLEEALELVQATGCSQGEAHQLVDYVYGRAIGDPPQEVGGVMVTLAALCLANDLDMHSAGEVELARIWTKVEQIRAKQATKPRNSPLPALTHPQQSKPLSEEQIKAGLAAHGLKTLWPSQLSDAFRLGIKFAESHCGIKEQS